MYAVSMFDYKKRLSEVKKMSRADRIELGKELLNELEAKNIPVNDNLRNDLEHGVPKAIVNAEKKLANAETNDEAEQKIKPAEEETPAIAKNEPAENVTEQDKQEVKTGAEPSDDGNKKATNEGGYKLADGYKTESGKPINEADEREFIVKPDGSKDFGEISQAISKAVKEQSGIELNTGKIRLRVGNEKEGLIHAKKHEQQAKDDGYNSIEDMIADVASSFDEIYLRTPKKEGDQPTYSLVKRVDKSANKMNGTAPVYFDLQNDGKGQYYIVITAIPVGDKSLKRQTKKDRLIYSSPGLDTATTSNGSAVSRSVSNNVGAEQNVLPTSDKSSGFSTSNISQEQKPSKGTVKKKRTERAGTESNETVAEGNGGEVSSEHTQGTETIQSEPVVKDEKPKEEKKHRIFSTQEEAEKELEKALGIRPVKKKAEEKPAKAKDESKDNKPKDIDPKKFAGVDISEEAEAKLVAELNEWLKSICAVSSRKLEVKPDYERGYILVDGGVGKQIDRGLDILLGNDEKGDRDKYNLIAKMIDEKLKKNGRRYLLEAVKAKAAIPIIKEYLKAGKQVVVFHDFKKNEATNPFMLISDDFAELDPSDQAEAHKQYEDFCAENPELLKLDMKDLMSPIERFQLELGKTVGIFNGDVKKSLRQDSVDKFNKRFDEWYGSNEAKHAIV